MKRLFAFFLIFSLLFIESCDYSIYPVDQDGTVWSCENPLMCFTVDHGRPNREDKRVCLGKMFDENDLTFSADFEGNLGVFIDADKHNNGPYKDAVIFKGRNKFNRKKITITVTESKIESVSVGDKITFNRVDKLPKWADELEITKETEETKIIEETTR